MCRALEPHSSSVSTADNGPALKTLLTLPRTLMVSLRDPQPADIQHGMGTRRSDKESFSMCTTSRLTTLPFSPGTPTPTGKYA
jgi:hypothetical protein